ncbi:MAG: DUF4923 family protein [Candidatus Amulumruptor caecigallinarius]|nr:DUF4923 family protein [Candidatus Amulumruptor caecigallinarius]
MKKLIFVAFSAIFTILNFTTASAQNLSDIFKGESGNILGNMLEGVFSSSEISISDMCGEWKSSGPAVCFQGEGFLKKAGGIAAAATIESKLEPYYKKYGLDNASLTIDSTGNFKLNTTHLKLSGNITQTDSIKPGVFEFNFRVFGKMKIGSVTTYVQKTSESMDVMFDATKLKGLINKISTLTGIDMVKTLSTTLDSYDGLSIGFHFTKLKTEPSASSAKKNAKDSKNTTANKTSQNKTSNDTTSGRKTSVDKLLDILKSKMGK